MCGRYVVKNPVTKTNKLVKSAIQVEDTEYTAVSGYGTYRKFRHFIEGKLMESYYIPSSSADTGSGIPSWDG